MKGKTPVKINEVQFLVEVKTQAERPGSLICSTNWNLVNQIVNRYVLAVLHQFVITILVNGIKKTIQAITIA